jgi:tellurite resistance protein TehA-like permease
MLTGTVAAAVAPVQSPHHRIPILIAGLTFQGLEFWVVMMVYASYLSRLMQWGLPEPNLRPGMFIAVGPSSFTALALIQLSEAVPLQHGSFTVSHGIVQILHIVAVAFSTFIWSLSLWFFITTQIDCLSVARELSFHLVW